MIKNQTFVLNLNPKNGTVVIPKKAREALELKDKFILKISGQRRAEIEVPEYSAEDVLYNLTPLQVKRNITTREQTEVLQEAAVDRYLNSKTQ